MEIKWLNPDAKFDRLVLAGDIGGTNTNLGLVGYKDGKFTLILETVCPSQCIEGLDTPIRETLKAAIENRADLKPSHICISAAGPVANNKCVMTNLPWCVDGDAITNATGIPTLVINDFMAISYGIPTLDVDDPKQILKFKHTDGSEPKPQAATKAVIGPGTGMGVGFLAFDGQKYIPAKMLARFASDACTLFLPLGGFYLAGGTVQKDLRWLERDNLFMTWFEKNYNPNIRPLLNKIPVYLIKDVRCC